MRFKLLVIATRTDRTERVIAAAKKVGATGATVLPARGIGAGKSRTFFGLSLDIQRDLILLLLPRGLVKEVMGAIHTEGGLKKSGSGIAFVLDVAQVTGVLHTKEENKKHDK